MASYLLFSNRLREKVSRDSVLKKGVRRRPVL